MKKDKLTNSSIGTLESALKKSKKEMIRDFYNSNYAETEELGDMFFRGVVKSGIAVLLNLTLYKFLENPNPGLADCFKLFTIASVVVGGVISVLGVLLDLANRRNARIQYKMFYDYIMQTGQYIDLSIMDKVVNKNKKASKVTQLIGGFSIVENENNEISTVVLLVDDASAMYVPNDDFVKRICDLDTLISTLEYQDKNLDDVSLCTILKDYAKYCNEEEINQEVVDGLVERLESLESKVNKIAGTKKLIRTEQP